MKRAYKSLWKRKGAGSLSLYDGQEIPPNTTFRTDVSNIPKAFMDLVEKLEVDKDIHVVKSHEPEVKKPVYITQEVKPGWYNVIDQSTGKSVNPRPLRQAQANQLIQSL